MLLPQHPVTLRAGSSVFKAGFVTAGGKRGCWSQASPSIDSYETPAVRVSGTHRGQLVSREQPGEGFTSLLPCQQWGYARHWGGP